MTSAKLPQTKNISRYLHNKSVTDLKQTFGLMTIPLAYIMKGTF